MKRDGKLLTCCCWTTLPGSMGEKSWEPPLPSPRRSRSGLGRPLDSAARESEAKSKDHAGRLSSLLPSPSFSFLFPNLSLWLKNTLYHPVVPKHRVLSPLCTDQYSTTFLHNPCLHLRASPAVTLSSLHRFLATLCRPAYPKVSQFHPAFAWAAPFSWNALYPHLHLENYHLCSHPAQLSPLPWSP